MLKAVKKMNTELRRNPNTGIKTTICDVNQSRIISQNELSASNG